MIFKLTKGEGPVLFKYISSVQFSFDPFSSETRSIREMLRQVSTPTNVYANPRCKINVNMGKGLKPTVGVGLIDGSKFVLEDTGRKNAAMLMSEFYLSAARVEDEYLHQGKPAPT